MARISSHLPRWLHWTLIAGGCAAALAGATQLPSVWRAATPERANATPGPQSFDFGERRFGETVQHVFRLENPSDDPLVIKDVIASCSCTVPKKPVPVIPARSAVEIPVSVELTTSGEKFASDVTVLFERHPPVKFEVSGRVVHQHPQQITFPKTLRGDKSARPVVIRALSNRPLRLKGTSFDESYFKVIQSGSAEASRDILLEFSLNPEIPYGSFERTIDIETDDAVEPVKRIKVAGHVARPLEADPQRLFLGVLPPGQTKTARVAVLSPYGKPLHIARVAVTGDPEVSCDASKITLSRGRAEIPVAVRTTSEGSLIKAVIEVTAVVGDGGGGVSGATAATAATPATAATEHVVAIECYAYVGKPGGPAPRPASMPVTGAAEPQRP